MSIRLSRVVAVALAQGAALRVLHHLAEQDVPPWSELVFLLPAYACIVGVPLTYYLLRAHLRAPSLATTLLGVGVALGATAAWVGFVNGPVAGLRPAASGSVVLYAFLAVLGWFVALPFLRLGVRGRATPEGYVALFDEAWRLAITLAFATFFVQLFWGLLGLFVALFEAIHVHWPERVVWHRNFAYPATCVAASFAIGLTDVRPEMFRGLRRLLLALLRWLAVLTAAMVLLFLGTLAIGGVTPLWSTRFATSGLIATSLALITGYNTIYGDGRDSEPLPSVLGTIVRAASIAGPALAALALWALALRVDQHGISEDRLHAGVVVTILAGYLVGYGAVAAAGARAPFAVRHVNVVMALAVVGTLLLIHSPLVDLKRIATASQLARLTGAGEEFDFSYLRHGLGRHGLVALEELGASGDARLAQRAQAALAETDRGDRALFPALVDQTRDRRRFAARFETYPVGERLPDDLETFLFDAYSKARWELPCVDGGQPCVVLLVDLDGDGEKEAVVSLTAIPTVYARHPTGWERVGRLEPRRAPDVARLRPDLVENRVRALPPSRYSGIEVGGEPFVFAPAPPPP